MKVSAKKEFTGALWGEAEGLSILLGLYTALAENASEARGLIEGEGWSQALSALGYSARVKDLELLPTGEQLIEASLTVSGFTGLYSVRTKGIEVQGWGVTRHHSEMDGPYNVYGVKPDRLDQLRQQYPNMGWF